MLFARVLSSEAYDMNMLGVRTGLTEKQKYRSVYILGLIYSSNLQNSTNAAKLAAKAHFCLISTCGLPASPLPDDRGKTLLVETVTKSGVNCESQRQDQRKRIYALATFRQFARPTGSRAITVAAAFLRKELKP